MGICFYMNTGSNALSLATLNPTFKFQGCKKILLNLKTKKKKRQRKENNVKNIRKSWKNSKNTKKELKETLKRKTIEPVNIKLIVAGLLWISLIGYKFNEAFGIRLVLIELFLGGGATSI